jgi:ABC-type dipeptide/oligopeptide/nickel transport system permease component
MRAALARGCSRGRAIVVHGLRGALVAPLTLAALEAPMALGGAFVVERVFGLPGLGEATIRAVQERDVGWLMALALFTAASAATFVLVTDLGYSLVDPRLRSVILAHRRAGGGV